MLSKSQHPHREGELSRLQTIVAAHESELRHARLGRRFSLDGTTFRHVAAGRNMLYHVSADGEWFLKILREPNIGVTTRERVGEALTRKALSGSDQYTRFSAFFASDEPAYVLSSRIPGRPLNTVAAVAAWAPSVRWDLTWAFTALGTLLATLHTAARISADVPTATTDPFAHLQRMLKQRPHDQDSDALGTWLSTHAQDDRGGTFIHGNFRLDNLILDGPRIGVLDFENSGSGSSYQDLSRPVAELALSEALLAYPRQRPLRWIRAFLDGYRRIRPFEPDVLSAFVCARLGRFYLESQSQPPWRLQVRGVPVVRSRLRRLLYDVLTKQHSLVPDH